MPGSTGTDDGAETKLSRRARLLRIRQLRESERPDSDRVASEIAEARAGLFGGSPSGLAAAPYIDRRLRLAPPTIQAPEAGAAPKDSPKVTVVSFNVTHNHLARAYILADMLRSRYRVEIVGPVFTDYGQEIWSPLQQSRIPIKWFYGMDLPAYAGQIGAIANQLDSDAIIVSKPMLPSLLLGVALKSLRNKPLILDIDDFEPGAFIGTAGDPANASLAPSLDWIIGADRQEDFAKPYGEQWTRYCDSVARYADAVTVANSALRDRYGGTLIPQVRDEASYDPALYDRDAIRALFGYGKEDRVVLFLGTPYRHKGILRVAEALKRLGNDRYKLCIVGTILDDRLRADLLRLGNRNVQFLPDQYFHEAPRTLCVADLVCLLQDLTHSTAWHQMPAKFADALAMGVPMIGTATPPLIDAARKGLIELVDDEPLHDRIDGIFSDYARYKERALRNRSIFLEEYSYAANRAKLIDTIENLSGSPPELPAEFSRLVTALGSDCTFAGG